MMGIGNAIDVCIAIGDVAKEYKWMRKELAELQLRYASALCTEKNYLHNGGVPVGDIEKINEIQKKLEGAISNNLRYKSSYALMHNNGFQTIHDVLTKKEIEMLHDSYCESVYFEHSKYELE